jgi:hypothetical protein
MKPALEALKQKFKEQDEKKTEQGGKSKSFGDMYPFWNIDYGQEAEIRTLPYAGMPDDAMHPFIDKLEHVLSINGEDKKIPCLKMYGEECPICALSAKYYKAEGKTSTKGKYYWRDKKSLASVYVAQDPLPPNEETKENDQGKMKLAQLGNQLSGKYESRFKTLLAKDDIDDLPWSLDNGLNFIIIKEKKGEYDKYDTSSDFARKSSSLPKSFLETFEPVDLRKYLPVNPGLDKVQRMLDAHVTGSEYVDDSESSTKTEPETKIDSGVSEKTKHTTSEVRKETSKPEDDVVVVEDEKTVNKAVKSEDSDQSTEENDFLAKLRRRAGKE